MSMWKRIEIQEVLRDFGIIALVDSAWIVLCLEARYQISIETPVMELSVS